MSSRATRSGPQRDQRRSCRNQRRSCRIRTAYSWALARFRLARSLGPDVGHRLLGVGQDQRPPVIFEHLHPVHQDQLASPTRSTSVRMSIPFCSQGVCTE